METIAKNCCFHSCLLQVFYQSLGPKCSANPNSNSHLERVVCKWVVPHQWAVQGLFWKILCSNFHLHMKGSKWGRKCIIMNCASHDRSPQQITLQQLPFTNEVKPHNHCRAFWVVSHCSRRLLIQLKDKIRALTDHIYIFSAYYPTFSLDLIKVGHKIIKKSGSKMM